jgi:hypothetical protein
MHTGGDRLSAAPEAKEKLGDSLLIARILRPDQHNTLFAEIVGIPFEKNQFSNLSIDINGAQTKALDLMDELNLLGNTSGVPHLSVGGETTQLSGWINPVMRTSVLDIDATRAYLVNDGLGVQGTGLVKYSQGENKEFGLGMPFRRNSGALDIGGGVDSTLSMFHGIYGHELWAQSGAYFGKPRFARLYGNFPFQSWMKYDEAAHEMDTTSLIIREDGKRNIPRKIFLESIVNLMPFVADEFIVPKSSFEIDGHNAFMRNGEVIFTDYELQETMSIDYVNFMITLSNEWYFDELRRNFDKFCNVFGFNQLEKLHQVDHDDIYRQVNEKVTGAHYRDDLMAPLLKDLIHEDKKAVERYAIAGLMASKACGRLLGRKIIRPFVENFVNSPEYENLHIEDVNAYLQGSSLEKLHAQTNHLEETVRIVRNEAGELCFSIDLKTFGLPVEPNIVIPIDRSDIYDAWPYDQVAEAKSKLIYDDEFGQNPFANIQKDEISTTLYSKLAGAFANIYGVEDNGVPQNDDRRTAGYEEFDLKGHKKFVGEYHPDILSSANSIRVLVEGRDDITIDVFPKEGKFSIDLHNGAHVLPIADLNKLAYITHMTVMKLEKDGQEGEIEIKVSGI